MKISPQAARLDILIVEDNALIAFELQLQVEEWGYCCVGRHARSSDAMRAASENPPDVAIVDLNLADGRTGPLVVDDLRGLGIPSIVISGEARHHSPPLVARAVLEKPVNLHALNALLETVSRTNEVTNDDGRTER